MEIAETLPHGVPRIEPGRFADDRGWFAGTWNRQRMAAHGLDFDFVQDNHSSSAQTGTVRGPHFQRPPVAPAKLVRAVRLDGPDLGIDRGLSGDAVLSSKDAAAPAFADFVSPFTLEGSMG